MTTVDAPNRMSRRWALWGFVAGVVITVPATMFALLSATGEALHSYLVPSAVLLAPLSDTFATWHGALTMTIASLVNGVVYAAVAAVIGIGTSLMRRS